MQTPDYYQVLGVARGADPQRIRQAYRRLARKHHPDLNPGDGAAAERFRRIGEAYEVLSDSAKRRRYDALRANGGAGWPGFGRGGFSRADLSGLFSELFRGRPDRASAGAPRWHRPPAPPPETTIEVRLEEVLTGALRWVETGPGALRVRIPPGVADGARLRIPTAHGPAHVRVRIAEHDRFRRTGTDLEVEVPVRFKEAALGGEIEVPTLEGVERVRLPAGASGGAGLRLRGRGLPRAGNPGARGDLIARIRVTVPGRLTPEQREWVRRLDPDGGETRGGDRGRR